MVRPQASDISTDHLRSSQDDPKQARITLLQNLEYLKALLSALGDAAEYNVGAFEGNLAALGQGGFLDIGRFPLASQQQAEEGTNPSVLMTPLLVAQAIATLGGTKRRLSDRMHLFTRSSTYTPTPGTKDALVILSGAGGGADGGRAGGIVTVTSNANPPHHSLLRASGYASGYTNRGGIWTLYKQGGEGGPFRGNQPNHPYRQGGRGDLLIAVIDVSSGNSSQITLGSGGRGKTNNSYNGEPGKAFIVEF